MRYRVLLHPEAERELNALYDDLADRPGPAIAWRLVSGIGFSAPNWQIFPSAARNAPN